MLINSQCKNKMGIKNYDNNLLLNYFDSNIFSQRNRKLTSISSKNKLSKEPNFPGYYQLVRVDANRKQFKKPPESKFILNNYDFKEAVKYDEREFWRILLICLLFKQSILHTFFLSLLSN